jgi:hypothetical protein
MALRTAKKISATIDATIPISAPMNMPAKKTVMSVDRFGLAGPTRFVNGLLHRRDHFFRFVRRHLDRRRTDRYFNELADSFD